MRLRKKTGVEELLLELSNVVNIIEPNQYKGRWNSLFDNNAPINLELGMGRGGFLIASATKNSSINYIGIERISTLVYDAAVKLEPYDLNNIKFVWNNAYNLEELFEKCELDRIYLNFSDPWPKPRHAKKRLTNRVLLKKYEHILKPKGEIHFKTDNEGLFLFSIDELKESGWEVKNVTFDLHKEDNPDHIITEYEKRFIGQGKKICRLEAISPKIN